jgi:hypothetical protein
MDREELLRKVAPCGLVCHTCVASKNGVIQAHSQELLRLLESFDSFAARFAAHEPRLAKYPDTREVLLLFSEAVCDGCRRGNARYPGCRVSPCTSEKGYDFCFECESFPCEEVEFERGLRLKWLTANRRMRQIGAEAYFDEVKDKSHYL